MRRGLDLIPSLASLSLLAIVAACGAGVPTYRGFPVYPPEAVRGLQGRASFTVGVPDREAIVAELRQMVGGKENGGRVFELTERPARALREIERRAGRLGWHLLDRITSRDGGSAGIVFGRLARERVEVVTVTMQVPAVGIMRGARLEPASTWGTFHYEFTSQAAPARWDGFPICEGVVTAGPRRDARGVTQTRRCDAALDTRALLYGWALIRPAGRLERPGSDDSLFQRGEIVVRVSPHLDGRVRDYTFVPSAEAARLARFYREPAARVETVDAGCLVDAGRLVPRPYRIELQGGHIRVNGIALRDVSALTKDDQLAQLDADVQSFRRHAVVVPRPDDVHARPLPSAAELDALLAEVRRIAGSDEPLASKVAALGALPPLRALTEDEREQLARHATGR